VIDRLVLPPLWPGPSLPGSHGRALSGAAGMRELVLNAGLARLAAAAAAAVDCGGPAMVAACATRSDQPGSFCRG